MLQNQNAIKMFFKVPDTWTDFDNRRDELREEIANELDAVLDFEYTEEEFEDLCAFGVEIYRKAEKMTTDAIAYCINDLVEEKGKTVKEILKMNKWDFIDKASNWL